MEGVKTHKAVFPPLPWVGLEVQGFHRQAWGGGRGENLGWLSWKQQAEEGLRHRGRSEQGEVAYAWEGSPGVARWPPCWAVGNCQLVASRVNNYLWILSLGKSWKFLSSRLPVTVQFVLSSAFQQELLADGHHLGLAVWKRCLSQAMLTCCECIGWNQEGFSLLCLTVFDD